MSGEVEISASDISSGGSNDRQGSLADKKTPINSRDFLEAMVHPENRREESDTFDRKHFLRDNPVSRLADRIPQDRWERGKRSAVLEPIYRDVYGSGDGAPELTNSSLISPIYGERAMGDGEDLHMEMTKGLADLTAINIALQKEVLVDEGGFIPVADLAPNLREGLSVINNDRWLLRLKNHEWSIMVHEEEDLEHPGTFRLTPSRHDFADFHLGNMALFPREMNSQIDEATDHTIDRRIEGLQDANHSKGLVLEGEVPGDIDPLAWSPRGAVYRQDHSGINEIDNISDNHSYQSLLYELAVLPKQDRDEIFALTLQFADLPYAQRDAAIDQYLKDNYGDGETEDEEMQSKLGMIASAISEQRRLIVSITNFNTRHREGRNMTPKEQEKAKDDYLQGILRVAGKVHGDKGSLMKAA